MRALLIILFLILIGGLLVCYYEINSPAPPPILTKDIVDITASFKIITNGTTRVFTESKYHNLSKDVFITSQNPDVIRAKLSDITWADFFNTLPMSLTKNCLTTGTKQAFCTNENKKLYFFVNNIEDPGALDKVINENDYLLIEYK